MYFVSFSILQYKDAAGYLLDLMQESNDMQQVQLWCNI